MNKIKNENIIVIPSIKEIKLIINEKDNDIDITNQGDQMISAIQLSIQESEKQMQIENYEILYYLALNKLQYIFINHKIIIQINEDSNLNEIKYLKDILQKMLYENVKERINIIEKEQVMDKIKNILHQLNQKEINQYDIQLINLSCAIISVLLDINIEAIPIINEHQIIDEIFSIMNKLSDQQISRNILLPFLIIIELSPEFINILEQKGILPIIEKFLYNNDEDNLEICTQMLRKIVENYLKQEEKLNQFRIQFDENGTFARLVDIVLNGQYDNNINAKTALIIGYLYRETPLPFQLGSQIIKSIKLQIIKFNNSPDENVILLDEYFYSLIPFLYSPYNHKFVIADGFLKQINILLINQSKNNTLISAAICILVMLICIGDDQTKAEVIKNIQIETIVQLSNRSDEYVAEYANVLLEQMNKIMYINKSKIIQSIKEIKLNLNTNEKDNNIDYSNQRDQIISAIQLSIQESEKQKLVENVEIIYYSVNNKLENITIDSKIISPINNKFINNEDKQLILNEINYLKDILQRIQQKSAKERIEFALKEQLLEKIQQILVQINQNEINQNQLQLINLSCAIISVLLDDNIEAIPIINQFGIIDEILSIMNKLSIQQISRNILLTFLSIIELTPEYLNILIQKGILPIIEKFLYNNDEDILEICTQILRKIVENYLKEEEKTNKLRKQIEENGTLRRLVEIVLNNQYNNNINANAALIIGFIYSNAPLHVMYRKIIIIHIKQIIFCLYYKNQYLNSDIIENYLLTLVSFAGTEQNHKLIIADNFLKEINKILINESQNKSIKLLYFIIGILCGLISNGENSTKSEILKNLQIDTIVQLSNSSDKQVAEVANILLEQMNIVRSENQFLIIQSIKEIKLNLKTNGKDNNIDITEQDDEMNIAIQLSLQKNEEQKQMNNNYQIQFYNQQDDMIEKDKTKLEDHNKHNNKKLFEQQLFEQKFNKQQIDNIIENNYAQQINLELLTEFNNQIINGKSGIEQQLLCVINRIAEYGATITDFDQENMFFYLFNQSFLSIQIVQLISLQIEENNINKISERFSDQFIQLIQTFLFINKNKNIGYKNCEICFRVIKYQIDNLVNKLKQYKDSNKQEFEFEIDMKEGIRTLSSLYCILLQKDNYDYFSGKFEIHKIIAPLLHINCSYNIICNQRLSLPNSEIIQQLQGIAFEILGLLALNNYKVKQFLLINHIIFEHSSQIIILKSVRLQIQNNYSSKLSSSISQSSSSSYHISSYSVISGAFHLLHSLLDNNHILSEQATKMPRLIDSLITITVYMGKIQKELKMKEKVELNKYQNNNFIKWINQYGNEQQQRRMILEGKCIHILIELFGIGGGRISSNNTIGNALSDIQYIIHQKNNQSIQNQNQINLKSKINEDVEEEGSLEEIETHLFHTRNANDQILLLTYQIKLDQINGNKNLQNDN